MSGEPRLRVSALLTCGGTVLLCKHRKATREYWLLPGGGVEAGESMHVALLRELAEETGLTGLELTGPIAIAESIAPPETVPAKHVVHVIFHAEVTPAAVEAISSDDGAVHGHGLIGRAEIGTIDLRPPIHRFVERWRPGDAFTHLGELWAR
ncbi:MAG TPA: NUDIX hydrolase [Gaiellales bacterium]|nr:NUDIX hydrolase [Gaiellales bacterium]